ncbi:putative Tetratricopeptide repeat-like superfamily protein [Hibiscus syriacus]|uniref:Tetratricopeptide repeat-like superfamily protein n=1 Tax=Hibiscus syriacus TaxID=106335 RepID=A0A6A3CDJ3_HIBSY|nr:uncharacterized protein LOC120199489 [Hibiscus syriacus]KAE8727405.1 putative Tetratricopeptide repeat-like superfamily protein [Hibiscus syriacus]
MERYQPPSTGLIHLWPLILLMDIITPSKGVLNGTELLEQVCNHTSDTVFCVTTLIADPNAGGPQALAGDLANAALRSAQTKATHAQALIALLLQNATNSLDRHSLQICQSSNNEALSQLSSANNEFNSDSLDSMVGLMNGAAGVTKACLNEIQGRGHHFSLLAAVNADLIKLCEICIVSTRYFTIEDLY